MQNAFQAIPKAPPHHLRAHADRLQQLERMPSSPLASPARFSG
jgi:hypothetical protein